MRVILDANIFISYLLQPLKPGTIHQIITAAINQEFTLLLPEALLSEFVTKIPQKPFLAEQIQWQETATFVALLNEVAEKIPKITGGTTYGDGQFESSSLLAFYVKNGG